MHHPRGRRGRAATIAAARCERVGTPGFASTAASSAAPGRPSLVRRAHMSRMRSSPPLGLRAEHALQPGAGGVDPQAQDMDGLRAPGRGDFNPGHQAYVHGGRRALRLLEPRQGIVIGERQHLDAGCRRALHQFGGRQRAVGANRMGMQIDVGGLAHEGLPARPTASTRCPASTMNPCARSKPSLV